MSHAHPERHSVCDPVQHRSDIHSTADREQRHQQEPSYRCHGFPLAAAGNLPSTIPHPLAGANRMESTPPEETAEARQSRRDAAGGIG